MEVQKFVTYFRVSTQKQGRSGLGLEAQHCAIDDHIKQYGGQVVASFQEIESGKRSDRAEFNKALDYTELCGATLLVAKLDRLSRDLHVITALQKRGIKFIFCDAPAIDPLTIHVMAAVAENELRLISGRTKSALQAAKSRGIKLGNPHLDAVRNRNVGPANLARSKSQSEWKKKILKIISHLESEGFSTCQSLSDEMNARGLKSYRGCEFTIPIVSRLRRHKNAD